MVVMVLIVFSCSIIFIFVISISPFLSYPSLISSSNPTVVLSIDLNPLVGLPPICLTKYLFPAVNSADPVIVSLSSPRNICPVAPITPLV